MPTPPSATPDRPSQAPGPSQDDRRAAVAHPSLQRTLRAALELTARDLPEFDAGLRRLLVARYRADEGRIGATPSSRAKTRLLANEAAFRSMLPRIVALGLNAEFQRLDGHPVAAVRPEDGPAPRAAAIASFARSFHADEADGLAELDRRIAHQLGRATLEPGANPLRPAVFLHAVGLCWRTVAGGARDEIDVMSAYGALWLPALRRTVSTLVAGLPPAPGREDAHGAAAAGPRRAAPEDARRGGSTVERWAAAMHAPADVPPAADATRAPARSPSPVDRLRAGLGGATLDPTPAPA